MTWWHTTSRRATVAALAVAAFLLAASMISAQVEGPAIVGGQEADPGEWPWQVALVYDNGNPISSSQFCGGSLIAPDWVLTAAHCVDDLNEQQLDVVAGIHALSSPAPGFRRANVAEIIVHPGFNQGAAFNNDVALLRLATSIADRAADGDILPIARVRSVAAEAGSLSGRDAAVTGWGALSSGGAASDTLQEVVVPIITNVACQTAYNAHGSTITANMLCAGRDTGGIDSCQGDSGGPLVVFNNADARWEQAGVVSWGIGCAAPNTPGVYTRLANYRDWVQSQIAPRIAFVIDDTGSMTQEINDVKMTVNAKVDEFAARALDFEYHLITYKDAVTYRGRTTSPATIKAWVNALAAEGGGDCPEEMLGALDRLAAEAPRSEAWVLTDAGFHNAAHLPLTIYHLVRANVTVHPIIYSWCFAREGQDATTTDPGRAVLAGGESFAQLAAETGGHYFQISSAETQAATDILLNEMTAPSDLMLFRDTVSGEKSYGLDVDATAGSLNFMLNLFTGSAGIELRDPDGMLITAATPGVTVTTLNNVRYFRVAAPQAGHWQAKVSGNGQFALSASGETAIDFQYLGDTTLTIGVAVPLLASLTGPVTSPVFQLIAPSGAVAATPALFDDGLHGDGAAGDGVYGGGFTPLQPGSFLLRVKGTAEGGPFERTAPEMIRVHALRVTAPTAQKASPGALVKHQFAVTNYGPAAETVDLSASSTGGWIEIPPPASIVLAANETKLVSVALRVPTGATDGATDELALSAASRANPLVYDAASVVTLVNITPTREAFLPAALLGPTPTPTFTPTPTPTRTPRPEPTTATPTVPACGNVIANPGFEENAGWQINVNEFPAAYWWGFGHSGNRSMRTGIPTAAENRYSYSSAEQTVHIPSPLASARLGYWLYPQTTGTVAALTPPPVVPTSALDRAKLSDDAQMVLLFDRNGQQHVLVFQRENPGRWIFVEHDLNAFRGQTVTLYYGVYNNGWGGVTAMWVDDVALTTCR